MGSPRPRPKHLAKKLLEIRLNLDVSQRELVKQLGVEGEIHVSKYENDVLEPSLTILLAYARLTGRSG